MNKHYEQWLNNKDLDQSTIDELIAIKDNEEEIAARFTAPMQFGTAGLRSIMGAGIGRMNVYTVAQTTQALAELVIAERGKDRGVAIAYDSRNNSKLFAETAASVLAANDVLVYLFDALRPTPELSFAILYHNAIAGINITASHNPKEYNGYKVYWEDGAQLPPQHATVVSDASAKIDIFGGVKKMCLESAVKEGKIRYIGSETDEAYLEAVMNTSVSKWIIKEHGDSLNVIFSPFHGAGYKLVPEVLKRAGLSNLRIVKEQESPDGDFPTVISPNPENKEGFSIAIEMAKASGSTCELMIATDPDGDRVGTVVKDTDGNYIPLTGNMIGALLLDYIIKGRKLAGTLQENACAIKSVVSGNLYTAIAQKNGVLPINVLTGFKYIGEKIDEYSKTGEHQYILGFEESYGYLAGGYVRDKDAVGASLLIVEMASYYKSKGLSIYEALQSLYAEYGFFGEDVLNVKIGGALPMDIMKDKMSSLRKDTPRSFGDVKVTRLRDYSVETITSFVDGSILPTGLPKADMLYFELEDGTDVIIRPSGTEPKIKVYILAKGESKEEISQKCEKYKLEAEKLLK